MAAAAPKLISREVFVHIIVDQDGNISVDPDTFWVSQGGNQEVVWHCTSKFDVDFDVNDNPFYESHFDGEHSCSGLVKRSVQASKHVYKYTVRVAGAKKDPFGGVDP